MKIVRQASDSGEAWIKLPKNSTQVKDIIVERLLALRQRDDNMKYVLNQSSILQFLESMWGTNYVASTPVHNDRCRLFGIIISQPEFRDFFQRLSDGVQSRDFLDNPSLSLKQTFVQVTLAFNNEDVMVMLPDEAYDLEHIYLLDPNDESRISIERDRELYIFYIHITDSFVNHT